MRRVRIYREGVPSSEEDPRTILPGGVTFENVVPVMEKDTGKIIAMLSNIRRDHQGWVTGRPSTPLPEGYALAGNIILDKGVTLGDVRGRLVSAFLTDTPVWPGMIP